MNASTVKPLPLALSAHTCATSVRSPIRPLIYVADQSAHPTARQGEASSDATQLLTYPTAIANSDRMTEAAGGRGQHQ
ncbi:MAG: hypothetical protein R3E79_04670 [Caldilineaceae bacterium]